jgi:hypothetical protein
MSMKQRIQLMHEFPVIYNKVCDRQIVEVKQLSQNETISSEQLEKLKAIFIRENSCISEEDVPLIIDVIKRELGQ